MSIVIGAVIATFSLNSPVSKVCDMYSSTALCHPQGEDVSMAIWLSPLAPTLIQVRLCVCVCSCVRACVRARACVRVCCVCVRVYV